MLNHSKTQQTVQKAQKALSAMAEGGYCMKQAKDAPKVHTRIAERKKSQARTRVGRVEGMRRRRGEGRDLKLGEERVEGGGGVRVWSRKPLRNLGGGECAQSGTAGCALSLQKVRTRTGDPCTLRR